MDHCPQSSVQHASRRDVRAISNISRQRKDPAIRCRLIDQLCFAMRGTKVGMRSQPGLLEPKKKAKIPLRRESSWELRIVSGGDR
jgi:hypothetical protein